MCQAEDELDRRAKTPLYKQLYAILREEIDSEQLQAGDEFYSENALIQRFHVSRITVRSTLQLLENENYIRRSQGSSSIVLPRPKLVWDLDRITDDLTQHSDQLTTQILSLDKVRPKPRVRELLQLGEEAAFVYKLVRLRSIADRKMALSISYLTPDLPVDLSIASLEEKGTVYRLLADGGLEPDYCDETVEALNAKEKVCKKLDLPSGAAVFYRERISYSRQGKPLEFVQSYYNSEHIKYTVKSRKLLET